MNESAMKEHEDKQQQQMLTRTNSAQVSEKIANLIAAKQSQSQQQIQQSQALTQQTNVSQKSMPNIEQQQNVDQESAKQ